jgi:hypothetical protein
VTTQAPPPEPAKAATPVGNPTPAGNPNAIATRQAQQALANVGDAQDMRILNIAGRSDVERIETVVKIPADYQYEIKRKGIKDANGNWVDEAKVGLTADAYDYLNRVIGVTFFMPEWVHDQEGKQQRNPIHRKDYIYLRLGAVWYTPLGQLVSATEDVEVDFNLTWMDARINSYSAAVVTGQNGMPLFDDFGNPMVKLDGKDELKALKTLSQLRTFGPRYAQTVARVRLLKMASGIRSLPISHVADFPIKVVGYRDRMTPQERVARAGGDAAALYGRPADIKPLSAAELDEVGTEVDPDTETIDRDLVAARQNEPSNATMSAQAVGQAPRSVNPVDPPNGQPIQSWSAEDLADLDRNGGPER